MRYEMRDKSMNESDKRLYGKKQETMMMVIFALLLGLVILISKFVIGINFSLMEQGGYISVGYHEVHGKQMWALEFESFTGILSYEGSLPENTERRLIIHSDSENSELVLTVECEKEKSEFILSNKPLNIQIPGTQKTFNMTLSGTDVFTGYFNAVWE